MENAPPFEITAVPLAPAPDPIPSAITPALLLVTVPLRTANNPVDAEPPATLKVEANANEPPEATSTNPEDEGDVPIKSPPACWLSVITAVPPLVTRAVLPESGTPALQFPAVPKFPVPEFVHSVICAETAAGNRKVRATIREKLFMAAPRQDMPGGQMAMELGRNGGFP